MQRCPYCGTEYSDDFVSCIYDEIPLEPYTPKPLAPPTLDPAKPYTILVGNKLAPFLPPTPEQVGESHHLIRALQYSKRRRCSCRGIMMPVSVRGTGGFLGGISQLDYLCSTCRRQITLDTPGQTASWCFGVFALLVMAGAYVGVWIAAETDNFVYLGVALAVASVAGLFFAVRKIRAARKLNRAFPVVNEPL